MRRKNWLTTCSLFCACAFEQRQTSHDLPRMRLSIYSLSCVYVRVYRWNAAQTAGSRRGPSTCFFFTEAPPSTCVFFYKFLVFVCVSTSVVYNVIPCVYVRVYRWNAAQERAENLLLLPPFFTTPIYTLPCSRVNPMCLSIHSLPLVRVCIYRRDAAQERAQDVLHFDLYIPSNYTPSSSMCVSTPVSLFVCVFYRWNAA